VEFKPIQECDVIEGCQAREPHEPSQYTRFLSQDEIAVLLGVPNINYPEVEGDAIEVFFQRRDDKLLEGLETVEASRKHATTLAASDDPKRAFEGALGS
jgi:hypothetical protein